LPVWDLSNTEITRPQAPMVSSGILNSSWRASSPI